MTHQALLRLRNATQVLLFAHEADSWKGGGAPSDIPQIEEELRQARAEYEAAFLEVQTIVERAQ